MYSNEQIAKAIEKFIDGSASEKDLKIVNAWYYSFTDEEIIITGINNTRQKISERIKEKLKQTIGEEQELIPGKNIIYRRKWFFAAAAILFIITVTGIIKYYAYPVQHNNDKTTIASLPGIKDVAAPASTNATLILADGRNITLDSTLNGQVALQAGINIMKLPGGELTYTGSGSEREIIYNTLTVPRGSKVVTLTLSDGTQVWLNAESSLRYPVAYTNGELKVDITGEAYFEVSKNAHRKFLVSAGNTTTEVLGTHFNVNAYSDNKTISVTLLEGSLKVKNTNASHIIAPGQQASLTFNGMVNINKQADMEEAIAWKNGLFKFNREDLTSIMRKIERWYNVEINYVGDVKKLTFGGMIPSSKNVSAVLELLEMTGVVKFNIESSANGRAGRISVICN